MKKLFFCIVSVMALLSSCKKDDNRIFEMTADERLNQALTAYQTQLVGATNGWKAVVFPASGGAYGFYLKFNNSNRVQMYSDFTNTSSTTIKESSYRLKAVQQPSLLFDTYSYIHELADPDPRVNGGNLGQGLRSDFEFYFESASADTIHLVGRFNGSRAMLIRATAQEEQGYNNGTINTGKNIYNILTYFKRLTVGAQLLDIAINSLERTITFSWKDSNGVGHTFTTTYYFGPGEIVLGESFTANGLTISSIKNISWNSGTQILSATVNGNAATVTAIVVPIYVDTQAPLRWWQAAQAGRGYAVSLNGFHVNGVDDAFNMTALTNFYFLLYWPDFDPGVDLLGFVFDQGGGPSLEYGIGYFPTFTNGKIVLTYAGDLGTIPDEHLPTVINIHSRLVNPAGYYLVQTGPDSYDMVSASDGRAWINWF